MNRDPRVDPRPGDVVRRPEHGVKYTVIDVDSDSVLYDCEWWFLIDGVPVSHTDEHRLLLWWRDACADAKIVKVADG